MAEVAVPVGPKWYQSSFYREAVENAAHYNSQLFHNKALRLPYLDAQTGIAQTTSPLLRSRLERRRGVLHGQIFSYPPRRWRKEPPPLPKARPVVPAEVSHSHSHSHQSTVGSTASAGGLIQTTEGKRSTRIATQTRNDVFLTPLPGPRSAASNLESPESSEMNEDDESPEPIDADYLEEYDSEEERKQKKKKKASSKAKAGVLNSSISRSTRGTSDDKPFHCTSCNRRYKTAASLKAHRTQYHGGEHSNKSSPAPSSSLVAPPIAPPIGSASPSPRVPVPTKAKQRIPVVLPPPPNLEGKADAKPSPYCDFCLGDNNFNRKSSKPEPMVSCTTCGRSAHPSCMQFSESLAAIVHTYRWQCIECKSCHFCGTSENDDQLLFCDDCDRGYHMYCLKPPIKTPPEGSWACGMCYKVIP